MYLRGVSSIALDSALLPRLWEWIPSSLIWLQERPPKPPIMILHDQGFNMSDDKAFAANRSHGASYLYINCISNEQL